MSEKQGGLDAKRQLAIICDEVVYTDSYGVEGSDFQVCRWCGGGSGPGGNPPFTHMDSCLFSMGILAGRVADVFQEETRMRSAFEGYIRDCHHKAEMTDQEVDAVIDEWLNIADEVSDEPFSEVQR